MRKLPYQSSLQFIQRPQLLWNDIGDRKLWRAFNGFAVGQLFPPDWAEMPIKVTYQNPGLEYDENMVCEDFLNMGMLPLEKCTKHTRSGPLLAVEMSKKCTPLRREAHVEVKMYKTHHVRTTFGSWDVEKVHAVVARSTFRSQNVQNTRGSDHFWRFRCRKSACRCGAKHVSKSKCSKH